MPQLRATKEDAMNFWKGSKFKRVRMLFKRSRTRAQKHGADRLEPKIVSKPGDYQIDVIYFETDGTLHDGAQQKEALLRRALTMVESYTWRAYMESMTGNNMECDIIPAYKRLLERIKGHYEQVATQRQAEGAMLASFDGIPSATWAPNYAAMPRSIVLQVSGDNEFDAAAFRRFNESLDPPVALINFVSKYVHNPEAQGGNSLGIIDSFARTIKHMTRTYALSHNNTRWNEYLQDVIGLYNDTPHAGLKMMTPDWVFQHPDSMWDDMMAKVELNKRVDHALRASDHHTKDEVREIMGTRRHYKVKLAGKLAIGDMVMVLKDKASKFAKGPRTNLDRIFVVFEALPRLRYRVAEYADLLAKGLRPSDADWVNQVQPLDRVYARPELYKLSEEDLPEDGQDLGLSLEEYQQAREDLREELADDEELDDPEDRDFVAVKEEPDEEEIDEVRGGGATRRRDKGRDESLQEFPEAYRSAMAKLWDDYEKMSTRELQLTRRGLFKSRTTRQACARHHTAGGPNAVLVKIGGDTAAVQAR
jgi:hypothetical protein